MPSPKRPLFPHCKYQVKPHSYPWSSATCEETTACDRNHFFWLQQQKILQQLKQSSDGLIIITKGFLKLSNLLSYYKNKPITSQKHGSCKFWQITSKVLNKGKSAISSLFNIPKVLFSASDKTKLYICFKICSLSKKTL